MIAALDALGLLAVLVIGILVYRRLIHSRLFAKFIGDVTHPSPETDDEVLKHLSSAEQTAWTRAEDATYAAAKARETATEIKRRVRRKPTPF